MQTAEIAKTLLRWTLQDQSFRRKNSDSFWNLSSHHYLENCQKKMNCRTIHILIDTARKHSKKICHYSTRAPRHVRNNFSRCDACLEAGGHHF